MIYYLFLVKFIIYYLLVVEVAVERVALAHRHPRVGQPVRVQVLGQLRLGRVPQEDEVALGREGKAVVKS